MHFLNQLFLWLATIIRIDKEKNLKKVPSFLQTVFLQESKIHKMFDHPLLLVIHLQDQINMNLKVSLMNSNNKQPIILPLWLQLTQTLKLMGYSLTEGVQTLVELLNQQQIIHKETLVQMEILKISTIDFKLKWLKIKKQHQYIQNLLKSLH